MKEVKTTQRLLQLQNLLIQFAMMNRLIYLPQVIQKDRPETNTEHSYSLAMTAWYLCALHPHLNKDKVIKYALVHDLVELYAGDEQSVGRTKQAEVAKQKREHKALLKLKKEWHDFSDMTEYIAGYENKIDNESKFVYALDKLMTVLLNMLDDGNSWKRYNFTQQDIFLNAEERIKVSTEVYELWLEYKKQLEDQQTLFYKEAA